MTVGIFLLICLASYRLTRLITRDDIAAPLRSAVQGRFPGRIVPVLDDQGEPIPNTAYLRPSPLVVLVNCAWCVSVWTTLALFLLAHFTGLVDSWQIVVLGWLAASTVAGFITRLEQ